MALQFDTAVPSGTPASNCAACKTPLVDTYYTAGKALVCPTCKTRLEDAKPVAPSPATIARATVFGIGGAIAGGILYYAVPALTGYQISIVAIAVGWLVGRAVHLG